MEKDSRKDYINDKGQMKDGKDRPKNKDGNSKGCWTCGGPPFGQVLSKPGKSKCFACWKYE